MPKIKEKFYTDNCKNCDSLHDQLITKAELKDNCLILYFDKLVYFESNYIKGSDYYEKHKKLTSCKIKIKLADEPEFLDCELTTAIRKSFSGKLISIKKFVKIINKLNSTSKKDKKKTSNFIEMLDIAISSGRIIMSISISGKKFGNIRLDLPASEITYIWKKEK